MPKSDTTTAEIEATASGQLLRLDILSALCLVRLIGNELTILSVYQTSKIDCFYFPKKFQKKGPFKNAAVLEMGS